MGEIDPGMWWRWRRRAARSLALVLPGSARLLPAPRPLPLQRTTFAGQAKELLVFLPGVDELPGDFRRRGFMEEAWRAGLWADAVEPDLHLGYFLQGLAVETLHEDVIRPARARGYERIWLVGLALGGFGALRYAQAHGDAIDGVVLLAPALGRAPLPGALWQTAGAGSELPGAAGQQGLWQWLPHRNPRPPIYLAFGDGDRYAPCNRLLAEFLPKGHVFSTAGDHSWPTWAHLWTTLLARVLTQTRHA